jgi:hypothetical protein
VVSGKEVELPPSRGMLLKTHHVLKQGFSMLWLLAQVNDTPRPTPEEWDQIQQEMYAPVPHWGLFLSAGMAWVIGLLSTIFWIWMILYCIRNDSERQTWLWILLFFPGVGPLIYFFARWVPSSSLAMPTFLKRWTEASKIRRLEASARQIGNPYQFIEWGDALRDTKQWEPAAAAYRQALQKEPRNLPALWGLSICQVSLGNYTMARDPLSTIMSIDPAYKFGDVSLLYGRTLHALGERDAELEHWRTHMKRWRQPEAAYSLAEILIERGENAQATQLLQSMIADIEITPRALARKVFFWKGRGKKLLRSIPKS